jgi:hypothetical protein
MILGTFYEVKNPHSPPPAPRAGDRKRKLKKEIETQGLFPLVQRKRIEEK